MTTTRSSSVAVTSAAVVLLLATIPGEVLGAQLIEGALPEHATFHRAVTDSIHAGDEELRWPRKIGQVAKVYSAV